MKTSSSLLILVTSLISPAFAAPAQDKPAPGILLITAPELAEAWQPFADWKTRLGKPTTIVTTAEIADNFEGPDLQEKIRLRVRAGIDDGSVRWVILGGDSQPSGDGLVPDRDSTHTTNWGKSDDIPTDIYYLSKGNWDANGNGVYGEWKEDRDAIDYPDGSVGLGRIPVRTAADVAAYTEKVISFESNYPEEDFATTFTYTCPEKGAHPKLKTSWKSSISPAWPEGSAQWFLSGETRLNGDANPEIPLTTEHWLKLVNSESTGKLHMHGHGLLHLWALEKGHQINGKQLKKLTNENAYPAITTVSCFTGEYDSKKDPSIVENILRLPKAGAILVVCPAREGKPHFLNPREDFPLMVREGKMDGTTGTMAGFWAHALGKAPATSGIALMRTKAGMTEKALKSPSFHLCLCELNLLGDPSLDLRKSNPRTPKVEIPQQIKSEETQLVIQSDVPGATVCLSKGKEIYEVLRTDPEGKCTILIEPKTAGTILVSVSGPSLNAYLGEIEVR